MSFITRLIGRIHDMFIYDSNAAKEFGVKLIESPTMSAEIEKWDRISRGYPSWLDENIKTINMAKFVAETRAKLTTLDIGVAVSGSARAEYLQESADLLISKLREKLAGGNCVGSLVIKPNGVSWDFFEPGEFGITDVDEDGTLTGAIFATHTQQDDKNYTRLEYHRFEGADENGALYVITNKCYQNQQSYEGKRVLGRQMPLETVDKWAHIADEVKIGKLKKPLFGFFKVPGTNRIDKDSPLGCAVFADGIEELRSTDIAVSMKDNEIEDSQHIIFVGQVLAQSADNMGIKLPRIVKGVGLAVNEQGPNAIHEHTATLLTESRIKDINFNLSMLGCKCGFSEGMFVLDGQTGMITATQVEADDRDTIQTIKDDRDALKVAIEQAIAAEDILVSLYGLAPQGSYDIDFNFGDITYNYEEDRQNWMNYVRMGWVPEWQYLVKFEGMSEQEAKALVKEAKEAKKEPSLFPQNE